MEFVLIRWGTAQAAFVSRDVSSASAMLARCREVAPVKVESRTSADRLPDCEVTRGWKSAAGKLGAVWATGFGAFVGR